MTEEERNIPSWLLQEEHYDPPKDHDGFIAKSILSITGVLAHFRLDDGTQARFSPSAPAKIVFGLGCILLISLSSNYFFVMTMLAGVLARMALLPGAALKRSFTIAAAAALMTFLLMLPATFIGQGQSALTLGTKVFCTVGLTMCVTLSTPFNELTAALRTFHVPNLFIMTIDLALKNIVSLGQIAIEVLTSLSLRSVGKNTKKGESLGGVGGVVFLKASDASVATYEAMACRGFEGEYPMGERRPFKAIDLAWGVLLLTLVALFVYLEGLI